MKRFRSVILDGSKFGVLEGTEINEHWSPFYLLNQSWKKSWFKERWRKTNKFFINNLHGRFSGCNYFRDLMLSNTEKKKSQQYILQDQKKWTIKTSPFLWFCVQTTKVLDTTYSTVPVKVIRQDYWQMFTDQKKKQNKDMIQMYPHKANSKCIFKVLGKKQLEKEQGYISFSQTWKGKSFIQTSD